MEALATRGTPAVVMARLLAAVCKKASLSQSTVHGPAGRTGDRVVSLYV